MRLTLCTTCSIQKPVFFEVVYGMYVVYTVYRVYRVYGAKGCDNRAPLRSRGGLL